MGSSEPFPWDAPILSYVEYRAFFSGSPDPSSSQREKFIATHLSRNPSKRDGDLDRGFPQGPSKNEGISSRFHCTTFSREPDEARFSDKGPPLALRGPFWATRGSFRPILGSLSERAERPLAEKGDGCPNRAILGLVSRSSTRGRVFPL